MPYSQIYQISTWLSIIGKYIVGYHLHQVTFKKGVIENHTAITEVYGHLISFASFFKYWAEGRINKAPVIFEMRPDGAYETTFQTFSEHKQKYVFDIHSHTYYSFCSEDNPHDLINNAIKNGVSMLGICDHMHGVGESKAQYINEINSLSKEYKDKIKILCGIEIATLPYKFDLKRALDLEGYDYCLIENITDTESTVGKDLFEFCSKISIPCGIAHTDLFKYCDMYGYDYNEFFRKMSENEIFWEMNVSYDSVHKYKEHTYVLDFMKDEKKIEIIKNNSVYISVGFDSHNSEEYDGFKVHQMYDFLKSNLIKTVDQLFK